MTMKVIGAGLGRTGTSSPQAAMEILGFGPCYHVTEVFAHPEPVPVWEAAVRGEPVEWESVLGGYRAAVGWPAAACEGLMERYPGAKVILTVRDPERRYESTRKTIYEVQRATESRSPTPGGLADPAHEADGARRRDSWRPRLAGPLRREVQGW